MARQQKSKWCKTCKAYRLHVIDERQKTNMVTHVSLTIFTCGLWFPILVLLIASDSWAAMFAKFRCQSCGKAN